MNFYQSAFIAVASVLLVIGTSPLAQAQPDPIPFTQWLGGTGDWFDPGKWSLGVPNGNELAEVADGEASFNSEARAHWLVVGPSGPVNETGSVAGTADLVVTTIATVGNSGGTGTGTVERGTGEVTLMGADLRVLGGLLLPDDPIDFIVADLTVGSAGGTGTNTSFTGVGVVNIIDGNVSVPLSIGIGTAGGTGTRTTMVGQGTMNLMGGNVTTQRLSIGQSHGTGTATVTAVGEMTVTSGHIILEDSPLDALYDADIPGAPKTFLGVGTSGGTGSFTGNATGTLRVHQGSIVADSITIGSTSPISSATGSSHGSLLLEDSDLTMLEMTLGQSLNNGGPATGIFEQIGGITTGESLSLGPTSKIVLGIGGPGVGQDYSQIRVDNVFLAGSFEARFVDGFLPAPGDVFNLLVADNIAGRYNFQITGINTADYPNLVITRNDHLIRLAFQVPEPGTVALFVFGATLLVTSRRGR